MRENREFLELFRNFIFCDFENMDSSKILLLLLLLLLFDRYSVEAALNVLLTYLLRVCFFGFALDLPFTTSTKSNT